MNPSTRKGMIQKVFSRGTAVLVLTAFIATNYSTVPVYADGNPSSLPALSSQPVFPENIAEVHVSSELGKIQETFQGQTGETVVLVQDAHAIPDAQRSIRKLINHFQNEYGLRLVGVEGAASKLDPQIFRSFPEQEALKKILEGYLEKGELTGPSAAAILNEKPAFYQGLEDWPLYEEGLGLYLDSIEKEPEITKKLADLKGSLLERKKAVYSPELLSLDLALQEFNANYGTLVQVLQKLAEIRAPETGSGLELLLAETRKENEDTGSLESEVRSIAEQVKRRLISSPKDFSVQDRNLFNQKLQEFQTSRMSAGEFAIYLQEILKGIPVISSRLERLMASHKRMRDMEGTRFFQDFERYAGEVKESLFRSEDEKTLDRESQNLALLEKLGKLELSRAEWKKIQSAFISPSPLDPEMTSHISFYKNAEKREGVLLTNLLSAMKEDRAPASLIVAGGFHAQGLTEKLTEKGISWVLITPQISNLPENSGYQDHMRGQVSWKNYFKVKNGTVYLYGAFVRAVRDKLLQAASSKLQVSNAGELLKAWRDRILLDLVKEEKITEAGNYTPFIDEVIAPDLKVPGMPAWQVKAEHFLAGLRKLDAAGEFTEKNISGLLKSAMIPDLTAASLDSRAQAHVVSKYILRPETPRVQVSETVQIQEKPEAGETREQPVTERIPEPSVRSEARALPKWMKWALAGITVSGLLAAGIFLAPPLLDKDGLGKNKANVVARTLQEEKAAFEKAQRSRVEMEQYIQDYFKQRKILVINQGWLTGFAPWYLNPEVPGSKNALKRPFREFQNEVQQKTNDWILEGFLARIEPEPPLKRIEPEDFKGKPDFDKLPAWRFSHRYTTEELLENPARAEAFLDEMVYWDGKAFPHLYDARLGVPRDGFRVDYETGKIKSYRNHSAASKASMFTDILTLALAGNRRAGIYIASAMEEANGRKVDPVSERKKIENYAMEIMTRQIATYEKFDREYPGYGGFIPWYVINGQGIEPAHDWTNRVPFLDPFEYWQSSRAFEEIARQKGYGELADRYEALRDKMTKNAILMFHDGKGVWAESYIRDPRKQPVPGNYYFDINPHDRAIRNYRINDRFEGQLGLWALYLYTKDTDWPNPGDREKLFLDVRPHFSGIEYTTPKGVLSTQKWHWGSAHEAAFHWRMLPYQDIPQAWLSLQNFTKIQTWDAVSNRFDGFFASVNAPVKNNASAELPYLSSVGIPGIATQPVIMRNVWAPYAFTPVLISGPAGIGAAWMDRLLDQNRMTGPYGAVEAVDDKGWIAPYVTFDGRLHDLGAMQTSGEKITTGSILREAMKKDGVYETFLKIETRENDRVFPEGLKGMNVPWAEPPAGRNPWTGNFSPGAGDFKGMPKSEVRSLGKFIFPFAAAALTALGMTLTIHGQEALIHSNAIVKTVKETRDGVVTIRIPRKGESDMIGSGAIIKAEEQKAFIVTNSHVTVGRKDPIVILSDGTRLTGRLFFDDPKADLAVVQIDITGLNKKLQVLHFQEGLSRVGETVIAAGSPRGQEKTFSKGVVSAVKRKVSMPHGEIFEDLIQTSAPISPGSSGGPLLNIHGEVIGINTAIRDEAQGIGFAISADRAKKIISTALRLEARKEELQKAPDISRRIVEAVEKTRRGIVSVGIPRKEESDGAGAGFIVSVNDKDQSALVMTHFHVTGKTKNPKVYLFDGSPVEKTEVIDFDSKKDLALVRITVKDTRQLKALTFRDPAGSGQTVIAVGDPFGKKGSITTGIISEPKRDTYLPSDEETPAKLIQVDVPINYGNSGGPLLNTDGEVIGMVTAFLDDAKRISFATDAEGIKSFLIKHVVPPSGEVKEASRTSEASDLVRETIRKTMPGVVSIGVQRKGEKEESIAAGFIVEVKGDAVLIVTDYQMAQGVKNLKVYLRGGSVAEGEVLRHDANLGLALVQINAARLNEKLQALSFQKEEALVGQTAIALGAPRNRKWSATLGIISGEGRMSNLSGVIPVTGLIQTDAGINPGSTGGPLVNIFGEVIAMVLPARKGDHTYALPGSQIRNFLKLKEVAAPGKQEITPLVATPGAETKPTSFEARYRFRKPSETASASPPDLKKYLSGQTPLRSDWGASWNNGDDYFRLKVIPDLERILERLKKGTATDKDLNLFIETADYAYTHFYNSDETDHYRPLPPRREAFDAKLREFASWIVPRSEARSARELQSSALAEGRSEARSARELQSSALAEGRSEARMGMSPAQIRKDLEDIARQSKEQRRLSEQTVGRMWSWGGVALALVAFLAAVPFLVPALVSAGIIYYGALAGISLAGTGMLWASFRELRHFSDNLQLLTEARNAYRKILVDWWYGDGEASRLQSRAIGYIQGLALRKMGIANRIANIGSGELSVEEKTLETEKTFDALERLILDTVEFMEGQNAAPEAVRSVLNSWSDDFGDKVDRFLKNQGILPPQRSEARSAGQPPVAGLEPERALRSESRTKGPGGDEFNLNTIIDLRAGMGKREFLRKLSAFSDFGAFLSSLDLADAGQALEKMKEGPVLNEDRERQKAAIAKIFSDYSGDEDEKKQDFELTPNLFQNEDERLAAAAYYLSGRVLSEDDLIQRWTDPKSVQEDTRALNQAENIFGVIMRVSPQKAMEPFTFAELLQGFQDYVQSLEEGAMIIAEYMTEEMSGEPISGEKTAKDYPAIPDRDIELLKHAISIVRGDFPRSETRAAGQPPVSGLEPERALRSEARAASGWKVFTKGVGEDTDLGRRISVDGIALTFEELRALIAGSPDPGKDISGTAIPRSLRVRLGGNTLLAFYPDASGNINLRIYFRATAPEAWKMVNLSILFPGTAIIAGRSPSKANWGKSEETKFGIVWDGNLDPVDVKDAEKAASRFHLYARNDGKTLVIRDLNSVNGSFVDPATPGLEQARPAAIEEKPAPLPVATLENVLKNSTDFLAVIPELHRFELTGDDLFVLGQADAQALIRDSQGQPYLDEKKKPVSFNGALFYPGGEKTLVEAGRTGGGALQSTVWEVQQDGSLKSLQSMEVRAKEILFIGSSTSIDARVKKQFPEFKTISLQKVAGNPDVPRLNAPHGALAWDGSVLTYIDLGGTSLHRNQMSRLLALQKAELNTRVEKSAGSIMSSSAELVLINSHFELSKDLGEITETEIPKDLEFQAGNRQVKLVRNGNPVIRDQESLSFAVYAQGKPTANNETGVYQKIGNLEIEVERQNGGPVVAVPGGLKINELEDTGYKGLEEQLKAWYEVNAARKPFSGGNSKLRLPTMREEIYFKMETFDHLLKKMSGNDPEITKARQSIEKYKIELKRVLDEDRPADALLGRVDLLLMNLGQNKAVTDVLFAPKSVEGVYPDSTKKIILTPLHDGLKLAGVKIQYGGIGGRAATAEKLAELLNQVFGMKDFSGLLARPVTADKWTKQVVIYRAAEILRVDFRDFDALLKVLQGVVSRSEVRPDANASGQQNLFRTGRSEVRQEIQKAVVEIVEQIYSGNRMPENFNLQSTAGMIARAGFKRTESEFRKVMTQRKNQDAVDAQTGYHAITENLRELMLIHDELADEDLQGMNPEALEKLANTLAGVVTANKFIAVQLKMSNLAGRPLRLLLEKMRSKNGLQVRATGEGLMLSNQGLGTGLTSLMNTAPNLVIREKSLNENRMQLDSQYSLWGGRVRPENHAEIITAALLWAADSLSRKTAEIISRDSSNAHWHHLTSPAALNVLSGISELLAASRASRLTASAA